METNMRTCASDICDNVFEVKSKKGKHHQIYCGPECRKHQSNKNTVFRTQHLGKSKAVMVRASRKYHRKKVGNLIVKNYKEKMCVLCGDLYKPTSGSQKYCDPDCVELYYGRTEEYMYVIEVVCDLKGVPITMYVGNSISLPVNFSKARVFRLEWEAQQIVKKMNIKNKTEILEVVVDDKYHPIAFKDKGRKHNPMPIVTYDRQPVCEDCD